MHEDFCVKGVSVLTLVKNREAHLLQLIEGLRRSDVQPCELVIVNMGDAPLQIGQAAFPVQVVACRSLGLPLAQARNLAAAQARCEKLLFLDVDCIPCRGLLAGVNAALDDFKGLLCAEVRYLAAQDFSSGWQEAELLRNAMRHPVRDFPVSGLRQERNYGLFWSLAFAIRRAQFLFLGGFDERFTGYGAEDTDFAMRARNAGIAFALLGGAGALHQRHEVFDPPLQHFQDILSNAQLFHDIWGEWPMAGWLDAFIALGLVKIEHGRLLMLRRPNAGELAAARRNDLAPF